MKGLTVTIMLFVIMVFATTTALATIRTFEITGEVSPEMVGGAYRDIQGIIFDPSDITLVYVESDPPGALVRYGELGMGDDFFTIKLPKVGMVKYTTTITIEDSDQQAEIWWIAGPNIDEDQNTIFLPEAGEEINLSVMATVSIAPVVTAVSPKGKLTTTWGALKR